ncbi:hypothetical protein GF318_03130 [Candidatus Micrarchaeota archaeon]|nr:hypothetical protein [Candidatus Micrarchaeota archaeon]
MSATKGKERRTLENLRFVINSSPPGLSRAVLKKMARMLGPDRLGELNRELGVSMASTPVKARGPAVASIRGRFLQMKAEELPEHVRNISLSEFALTPGSEAVLETSGISTVGDFIEKSQEVLILCGLGKKEILEIKRKLLGYGIRTRDNPPLEV